MNYADYLKKGNKVNPTLLAPKTAKAPGSSNIKQSLMKPPITMDGLNKRKRTRFYDRLRTY